MSKLKMLKFEAATLKSFGAELIGNMQKIGIAQLEKSEDERLTSASFADKVSFYEKNCETVSLAMDILKEKGASFGGGMFSGRKALTDAEFSAMSEKSPESLDECKEIISLSKEISEIKAEEIRLCSLKDSLEVWKGLDIGAKECSSKTCSVLLGTFPRGYSKDELLSAIAEALPDVREFTLEIYHSSKEITSVCFICHRSVEKELLAYIRSISFMPLSEIPDVSAEEKMSELEAELSGLAKASLEKDEKIKSFVSKSENYKFALDLFTVKADEYRALGDVGRSGAAVYLTGYVPEKMTGKLSKAVEKCGGAILFSEPGEDDDVPVLLSNGKFSEPCESIVEMYATPAKGDIDPSSIMAFFYYLLFGMMLSDAGYGLIMAVGTFIILKKTNVEGGMRKMLWMFFYSGISTVIWGALFGSWFGDIVPVVCREFLGIQNPPSVALWFEPIADPIKLLLFSFCIGIAHLFLGLFALFHIKWKDGDRVGAIFDTIPIIMTVLGAAPLAGSILTTVPAPVIEAAKYLAIAGVVLIVLTNSRSSKNILARLGGGLYGLYNIASGYLSDILSYSRLLALGLATGSIASVVNMLGVMPQNMVLKTVVFIVVFVVGHTLNMAINILGAYVHTNRLQFVELFSKFYEGGGRAFNPLKFNTKYFKLKEENKND